MSKAKAKRDGVVMFRRELARKVGRSESTVRKWIRRGDWPFPTEGPWEVARVKEWMALQLKPDNAKPYREREKQGKAIRDQTSEMTRAKTALVLERAAEAKMRRLELEGSLHDSADCRRRRLAQIHAVKGALLGLARSVSAELIGKDKRAIEDIIEGRVTRIIEGFASGG